VEFLYSLRLAAGRFEKFAAIRLASSLVSSFALDRRPGSSSQKKNNQVFAQYCPSPTKAAPMSSIDHGGGKRRRFVRPLS
jgi:hypothetical protein